MRPTEKDIKKTTTGYYQLDCDGRHHHNHMYLYYTKKEIMKLWRKEHPINNIEEERSIDIDEDLHGEWVEVEDHSKV